MLGALAAIAVVILLATPFLIDLLESKIFGAKLKPNEFGDQFGFTNALFSALAFAAFIVTLIMQKDELAAQHEEMRDTRIALEETRDQAKLQAEALNTQIRDNKFFAMIESFRSMRQEHKTLDNLNNFSEQIRVHVRQIVERVTNKRKGLGTGLVSIVYPKIVYAIDETDELSCKSIRENEMGEVLDIQTMRLVSLQVFRYFLNDAEQTYSAYFLTITNLIEHINRSYKNPSNTPGVKSSGRYYDAWRDVRYLMSQLSPKELQLIFLFSELPEFKNQQLLLSKYLVFSQYRPQSEVDSYISAMPSTERGECPGDRLLNPLEYLAAEQSI